jgi:dTDP-4-dehydrorhamnose 3,5-epimerase
MLFLVAQILPASILPIEENPTLLQRIGTALSGVYELRPKVFRDPRGFFMETYHREKFKALGIHESFVQDNHSTSSKGTLRGLHYQLHHPQAKLCRVIEGEAYDVALDVRVGSPTFGKWAGLLLSAKEQNQIYIPTGFAHGFAALTDTVQFLYKCSDFYDPADERGILWNDPVLGISWGISDPLISAKDSRYLPLASTALENLPRYTQK